MKYSDLDETLIFEAKRAFEHTISSEQFDIIEDGKISLRASAIDNSYPMPNLKELKKQIVFNIKNHQTPHLYVNELKSRFIRLPEWMKGIIELKYEKEDAQSRLWVGLAHWLDQDTEKYGEQYPYFYFGEKFEEMLSGRESSFISMVEFLLNTNEYIQLDGEEKGLAYLLERFNNEYYIQTRFVVCLTELLLLAETIQDTIQQAEEALQQPAAEVEPELTPIELKNGNHKLVLIHELGMIKFLKKKYPHLTDTHLGKILGPLIGETEQHVRRGLSGYGNNVKNDPKTDSAYKAVKGELIKFGIEIE